MKADVHRVGPLNYYLKPSWIAHIQIILMLQNTDSPKFWPYQFLWGKGYIFTSLGIIENSRIENIVDIPTSFLKIFLTHS